MNSSFSCRNRSHLRLHAFTLVEMLIAMAITLLMMAAIGRGFAYVGERVKDSRANLELSAELTDLTTRLRHELSRCTVDLTPNTGQQDQAGYFLYYEGPVADATSSLFNQTQIDPDDSSQVILPDSRYGDFDDYLAFTAVAPPGSWFTGKVPRYLLDQKSAELSGATYTAGVNAFDPVVVRSKYAEIVYFASPEYETVSLPASPVVVDADGNSLPDRIRLHRRVLLIRPDLNLASSGFLPVQTSGSIPFMQADSWPDATTATVNATAVVTDGWLYGMAGIHQQCDLSVRRVLNGNGQPTTSVAANSLEDLSKPHNRFAHVRVPNDILFGSGGANEPTSMPVLALGDCATILTSSGVAPPLSTSGAASVVTPARLSGFIRPEFVIGSDLTHLGIGSLGWGTQRLGEDVVVNNVLGFDIKIFDPEIVSLTTVNGLVVGPNDAGYRESLANTLTDTAASINRGEIRGGFVDLIYPVLAGGSLRGWQDRQLDRLSASTSISDPQNYIRSVFSGVALTTTSNAANAYTNSLYRSGRVVTAGGTIQLMQPAFDTYTSHYEHDGIRQSRTSAANEGTLWTLDIATANTDLGSDGLDGASINGGGQAAVTGQFGADDLGEHETLPPFVTPAEAIQVSVRLYNPSTRQIKQMSVVHRGKR